MAKAPSFWKPDEVGQFRSPNIVLAREEGLAAGLRPAVRDRIKRLAMGIDFENSFVAEDGTLKVPGAIGDITRFIDYLYRKAEDISALLFSLDQHLPYQIFFSLWWVDKYGNHPAPYTAITEQDVENGTWIPLYKKEWSKFYVKSLRETGQTPLMIWPEHCMIGTYGAALMPELAEAIVWLSAARGIQPIYMFKGTVPESEHYGPFCCCVPVPNHPQGGLQTQFLDIVASYDVIDVAGEAEDFCVREGMRQLLAYFGKKDPAIIKRMRFLKDCTSLVFPDKRPEADEILEQFETLGVQIINSTEA